MYAHGNGFRFVPPGGGKPVPLGQSYGEALRRYAEIVGPYREGERPLRTMADLLDRYEREVLPAKAPSTQETNRYELGLLRAVFGRMLPGHVQPVHVYGYMDRRPPTRANREVALLSAVFGKGVRWGVCTENPCKLVSRNPERARELYVDDAMFWEVYDRAGPTLQVAMLLCASCGFRGSELLRLRWDQCLDDGIHIQRGKGGRAQVLRYNATVREALTMARERLRRDGVTVASPWVLPRRDGRPYTASGFSSFWQRLRAGFQLRDLRAKSGSDHATGAHLGHQDGRTLQLHYRRRPDEVEVVDIPRPADITNARR